MDETQIGKPGSKMRDAYADVASEVPVPTRDTPKHPSRRLRKSRTPLPGPPHAGPLRRPAASQVAC